MKLTQELQKKRQEEIEGLRNDLQQLSSQLESLEINIKKMSASKQQVRIFVVHFDVCGFAWVQFDLSNWKIL